MLSHMSLLLSVVFGLLGHSACGFSIETSYDMVVVCVCIYICNKNQTLCHVIFVKWYCILHGVLVYSPCYFTMCMAAQDKQEKATSQSGNNNMIYLRG